MKNENELIGFIYSSSLRIKVLKFLSKNSPTRPVEIAEGIGKYQPHVSTVLKEFQEKGLVDCITPKKRSWRVYLLTNLGKRIVNKF